MGMEVSIALRLVLKASPTDSGTGRLEPWVQHRRGRGCGREGTRIKECREICRMNPNMTSVLIGKDHVLAPKQGSIRF